MSTQMEGYTRRQAMHTELSVDTVPANEHLLRSIAEILQSSIIQLQMFWHNIKIASIHFKMLLKSCLIINVLSNIHEWKLSVKLCQFPLSVGVKMRHHILFNIHGLQLD